MCPLAVPGLAFSYLVMSFLVILGHPLRKPFCVAFNNVDILGLHKDWCANLTALARVHTECMKVARLIPGWLSAVTAGRWGAQSSQGPGCGRRHSPGVVPTIPCGICSVHKSVDRSLFPVKITFSLNISLHFLLSNITLHPALQRGRMPMRDAIVNDGMMCPVNIVGRPRILISHTCVDWTFLPSGKLIVRGDTTIHLLSTAAPSMMNMELCPCLQLLGWLQLLGHLETVEGSWTSSTLSC